MSSLLSIDRRANEANGWRGQLNSGFSDEWLTSLLWSDAVVDQQAIFLAGDEQCVGYGTLYDVDLTSQTGWIALACDPIWHGTGVGIIGGALFVHHCFLEWPLRKLLMQVSGSTLTQFASLVSRGIASEVGRFEGRQVERDGSQSDVIWLQINRDEWREFARTRVGPSLTSGPEWTA